MMCATGAGGLWECGKPRCGFCTFPQQGYDACGAFSGLKEKMWQIGMTCVKVAFSRQRRKAGELRGVYRNMQMVFQDPVIL